MMKGQPQPDAFDPDSDGDNDFALIEHGLALFRSAQTAQDRRSAMIVWLRGATIMADSFMSPPNGDASPGAVLIAALEALEGGTSSPLLDRTIKPNSGARTEGERSKAKARAVVAVNLGVKAGRSVAEAIAAVCALNGMNAGALKSLRSHANGKTKQRDVALHLKAEEARWADLVQADPDTRSPGIITVALRQDREILKD